MVRSGSGGPIYDSRRYTWEEFLALKKEFKNERQKAKRVSFQEFIEGTTFELKTTIECREPEKEGKSSVSGVKGATRSFGSKSVV